MAAAELYKTVLFNNTNLKAYYRFEDNSNDAKGSNNGTDTAITYGTGIYGKMAGLARASSSKIVIGTSATLQPATAVSVSFWASITANPASYCGILGNTVSGAQRGYIFDMDTTNVTFRIGDGTWATTAVAIPAAGWHHYVGTWDGTNVKLFLDGKQVSSTAKNAISYTSCGLSIGNYYSDTTSANMFNGSIDDLAIFSSALTHDQIKELYEGRFIGELYPQTGLVGNWHLNGSSNDSSGSEYHGEDSGLSYSLAYGKFGQGAAFTKTSYTSMPSATGVTLQGGSWSLFAWIYQTSAGTVTDYEEILFCKDNSTTNNRCFRFLVVGQADTGKTGQLRFVYNGVTSASVYSTGTVSLNAWHHVGITYGSGTYTFYIDGNAVGSGNTNITPAFAGTARIVIGCDPSTFSIYTESLIGNIDEASIWLKTLSANEVRKMYARGAGKLQ